MSPRDRRALLVGGGAVLVALLALRALPWGWREGSAHLARLAAERELLAWTRADVMGARSSNT